MMRKKFVACGVLGWCMEIVFTGLGSLRKNEHSLTARTSIWMFPIYGMACFLTPLCRLLRKRNFLVRGMVYTCCIFTGEFLSGITSLTCVRLLPYHAFARSKYLALGRSDTMPQVDPPSPERMHRAAEILASHRLKVAGVDSRTN